MSRSIDPVVLEQLYSLTPNSVDLIIARVSYNNDTLYLVNNYVDVTYDGQVYTAMPFTFVLPDDKEVGDNGATLVVADVNGEVYGIVRTYDELLAEFELISRKPDLSYVPISYFPNFKLSSASWDSSTVSFSLMRDDATGYSFPKDIMDNTTLPNLY